jgi:4-hydroxybenzoate polyprenyltransferase
MEAQSLTDLAGVRRVKLFLALSRTPHGLLDMATPALCALLALGGFPSGQVVLLGLLTAFAGYTAVYALNDVVDYRSDRHKLAQIRQARLGSDLDGVFLRHPMAQGLISVPQGLAWTVGWALVALVGAYCLRPACAAVFLGACCLEAIYCTLLRVSYLRTVVSGLVKISGGLAAMLAVEPDPDPLLMAHLLAWLFLWEIGGQNVPNDWADLEEDQGLQARTLPVELGPARAAWVVILCLCFTVLLGLGLYWTTPARLNPLFHLAAAAAGWALLVQPAARLFRERTVEAAGSLFNRASYYPLAVLASVLLAMALG